MQQAKYDRSAELRMEKILGEAFPGKFYAQKWIRVDGNSFCPDFVQKDGNLLIEVNGSIHREDWKRNQDASRQKRLNKRGYYVVRLWNETIMNPKKYHGIVGVINKRMKNWAA